MKSLWEGLKARAEPVINFFKAVWGMITSAWSGDMEGMKKYAFDALNAVKQYFENAWNDIQAIVGNIVDWIQKQLWKMLPGWAQRWLGGEGDAKRAEVKTQEQAKASVLDAQKQIELVVANTVPANASETARTENVENNNQTNVTVGPPQITINTTDTKQAIQQAAKESNKAWSNDIEKANFGYADGVKN